MNLILAPLFVVYWKGVVPEMLPIFNKFIYIECKIIKSRQYSLNPEYENWSLKPINLVCHVRWSV